MFANVSFFLPKAPRASYKCVRVGHVRFPTATARGRRPRMCVNGLDSLQRAPPRLDENSRRALWKRIFHLEEEVRRAVEEERFEDAARLRDEAHEARQTDRFVYLKQALLKAEEAKREEEIQALREALSKESPPPVEHAVEKRTGPQKKDTGRKASDTRRSAFPEAGRKRGSRHPKPSPELSAALKRLEAAFGSTPNPAPASSQEAEQRLTNVTDTVDNGVRVRVETFYRLEDSKPEAGEYLFGYNVRIVNETSKTIQLVARYWRIQTKEGLVSEVRGPGVIGKQPVLERGEEFTYTSACPIKLKRPAAAGELVGSMEGSYRFVTGALGELSFEVKIGRFGFFI
ncbi:hypothetical protein, conserved [Cyanidioschyzon merolae strain 10D]|jgi:ApaG protein|uniref:Protein ApaG n=1 Tax=Cyanidioschyzon merolae (strain NIES-3377 / 10D) TaxID=280699 RepID=M1UPW0_CYAM1|nr:hypothetical protein, conserved [Cyanidioschyzon merolae strain 10D]BAM79506.1 hypothetical protein, conserved [Cyanidioschyzon merolae strain 10D]|eukprot:XP_005535792.1 hypothetical protein, conserved [Cyanidioschyzon merolae strain 10D]